MKKILVIGCSGAGKSTISRELGNILKIEVIHLDALYWNKGWAPTPRAEWRETVKKLCLRDRWIMDGNYADTLKTRLDFADTVIVFDYPRLKCLAGAIKRRIQYAGKTRPDMAAGCPEKIDAEFIDWIWNFDKNVKPQIQALISGFKGQLFVLKNRKDASAFLKNLPKL